MAQDVGVEIGEGDALVLTVAPLGALPVPVRAARRHNNALGFVFVLFIAQTVGTVDVALAVDVALVPRLVDAF